MANRSLLLKDYYTLKMRAESKSGLRTKNTWVTTAQRRGAPATLDLPQGDTKYVFLMMNGGKLETHVGGTRIMPENRMFELIAQDLDEGRVNGRGEPLALSEVRTPHFSMMFDLDFKYKVPIPVAFAVRFVRDIVLPVVSEFYPDFRERHADSGGIVGVCACVEDPEPLASEAAAGGGPSFRTKAKEIVSYECQYMGDGDKSPCGTKMIKVRVEEGYFECPSCRLRHAEHLGTGIPVDQPCQRKHGRRWVDVEPGEHRGHPGPKRVVTYKTGFHVRFLNNRQSGNASPLIVDSRRAIEIFSLVMSRAKRWECCSCETGSECSLCPFRKLPLGVWTQALDMAPYESAGLRVLGTHKMGRCDKCDGSKTLMKFCVSCNRTGKKVDPRVYSVVSVLDVHGSPDEETRLRLESTGNTLKKILTTSIRSREELTPGFQSVPGNSVLASARDATLGAALLTSEPTPGIPLPEPSHKSFQFQKDKSNGPSRRGGATVSVVYDDMTPPGSLEWSIKEMVETHIQSLSEHYARLSVESIKCRSRGKAPTEYWVGVSGEGSRYCHHVGGPLSRCAGPHGSNNIWFSISGKSTTIQKCWSKTHECTKWKGRVFRKALEDHVHKQLFGVGESSAEPMLTPSSVVQMLSRDLGKVVPKNNPKSKTVPDSSKGKRASAAALLANPEFELIQPPNISKAWRRRQSSAAIDIISDLVSEKKEKKRRMPEKQDRKKKKKKKSQKKGRGGVAQKKSEMNVMFLESII